MSCEDKNTKNEKKKKKKKEMRRHDSEEVVKKKKKRRHDDNVEVFQNEEVKKKKKKRKNSDNVFQMESQQVKKKKKKPETFEQCDVESQQVKKKKKKKKKNHFEQDNVLEIVELEHKHENNNRENEERKEEKSQAKKKKKKEKAPENSEHENIELREIKKKKKKKKKVEHSDIYYADNVREQIVMENKKIKVENNDNKQKAKKEKKKMKKKKKRLENVDFDNSEASTSAQPVGVEAIKKGVKNKLSTDGNDEIIILSKDEVKVERNQKKKRKRKHSDDDQSNVDAHVQSKRYKKKIEKLKEKLSTTIENHLRNDSQSQSEISSMFNTEEETEIKYLVDSEDKLNVSKIFHKDSPLTTEHKTRESTFKKTNKKMGGSIIIDSDSEFASRIIDLDDESSSQIIPNSHSEIDSEDTNVLKNSKSISTKLKHQGRSINNANGCISNGESELQAEIPSRIKVSSSPIVKISPSKTDSKVKTFKVNNKTRKHSKDDMIVNLSRFSKSYNMKTLVKHPLLLDWQVTYKQLSEAGVECHSGNWTTNECAILKENIKSFQNENLCKDFLNYLNNVRDSKEWKDFKGENIFIRLGENINRPIRYIKYKIDMWYPKDAPLKSNRFSEDEVKQLRLLQTKYGNNWKAIGEEMGRSREGVRCKFAAIKLKSERIITDVDKDRSETHNKFTSKEDDWIRKWVKMSLEKNKSTVKDDIRKVNWELAASKLKNRSAMACRQRWKLYLRTDITEQKKEPFQRRKLLAKKINITKHLIDSGINDSRDIDWKQLTLLLRCDEDPSLLHKRYINWLAVNKDLMRGDGFSEKLKHLYGHLQERVGQDTTLLD